MQIKTTMRYHLKLIRIAIIKMSTNNKPWRGRIKKGILLHSQQEFKLIQPLWKTVWRFLKKLGIKPSYDPAIPLLGIYPEETKIEKDTCTPMFIAALFTIARIQKQPKCPSTDEWIKKLWYIYAMEFYSAINKAMAPHSSTSCLENPMDGGAWQGTVHGVEKSRTRLSDFTFTFIYALEYGIYLSLSDSLHSV